MNQKKIFTKDVLSVKFFDLIDKIKEGCHRGSRKWDNNSTSEGDTIKQVCRRTHNNDERHGKWKQKVKKYISHGKEN